MTTLEKGIEKVFWRRRLTRISKREQTPIQPVRIVMFGLGGVGKTSLIHRFLFGKFETAYTATIEDDYRQVITYNDHIVDVTILDTAGSYRFPAMRKHAIQNGQGFLLVYAINNTDSLTEVNRIFAEISSIKGESCKIPMMIVGNKIDMEVEGERTVPKEEVNTLILSWGRWVEHIETSAKSDENVSLLFNKMIWTIDDKRIEDQKIGSIDFSTTYDKTFKNKQSPKRAMSVDRCPAKTFIDWRTSSTTHEVFHSGNRNLPVINCMPGKNTVRYSSQLLSWPEDKQTVEANKVKKKKRSFYGIFSRKYVHQNIK